MGCAVEIPKPIPRAHGDFGKTILGVIFYTLGLTGSRMDKTNQLKMLDLACFWHLECFLVDSP